MISAMRASEHGQFSKQLQLCRKDHLQKKSQRFSPDGDLPYFGNSGACDADTPRARMGYPKRALGYVALGILIHLDVVTTGLFHLLREFLPLQAALRRDVAETPM